MDQRGDKIEAQVRKQSSALPYDGQDLFLLETVRGRVGMGAESAQH